MTMTLLGISLVAYFLASVLYLMNLHLNQRHLAAYATGVTAAGFAAQSLRLIIQFSHKLSPFADAFEAIFFLSWAIVGAYLIVLWRYRLMAMGALAVPLSLAALALLYRLPNSAPLALDGWIMIHMFAIVASFALFSLAFCCAVFYLVQNKLLKSKKLGGMFRRLPPLHSVNSLAFHLAAVGFPLLTVGIVTGIVGVNLSSLAAQHTEAKLFLAFATWAAYAAYLLAHRRPDWRGKRSNWILIAGVALVAITTVLHNSL